MEADMEEVRHRRSVRLKAYDYSQAGAYFVTLCTKDRACLLGEVVDGEMRLNAAGLAVEQCRSNIPEHFPFVALDVFVVMPNHVHGIFWIVRASGDVGANDYSPLRMSPHGTSKTVGSIVRGFKIGVIKWMRQNHSGDFVWQRNYYEHIIRDEESLNRIRQSSSTTRRNGRWTAKTRPTTVRMPVLQGRVMAGEWYGTMLGEAFFVNCRVNELLAILYAPAVGHLLQWRIFTKSNRPWASLAETEFRAFPMPAKNSFMPVPMNIEKSALSAIRAVVKV